MLDEVAGGEFLQFLAIHRGLNANVEPLQGLATGEAGHAGAHRARLFLLRCDFFGQEPIKEVCIHQLLGTGLLQQGVQTLLESQELEVLAMFPKAQQLGMSRGPPPG
jgi:hypothetical protein